MFAKSEDDKIREWNNLIERYISLHKYIKDVGKVGITQGRSGHIDKEVQIQIKNALIQTDKTLHQLKNFFKPCLVEVGTSDVFPEEKLKVEIEDLNKTISQLTQENQSLKQKLQSNPEETYKSLHLETEYRLVLEDKKGLQEQIRDPEQHCKFLTQQIEELMFKKVSGEDGNKNTKPSTEVGVPIIYLKQQEQLEETLKAQNDLIFDLKRQLEGTIKEKDSFKNLNKDLEAEMQKKGHFKFDDENENEEENVIRSYDYSNRSTLRVDELTAVENKKLDFEKNFNNLQEIHQTILAKYNSDIPHKSINEEGTHTLEKAIESKNEKEDGDRILQDEEKLDHENNVTHLI